MLPKHTVMFNALLTQLRFVLLLQVRLDEATESLLFKFSKSPLEGSLGINANHEFYLNDPSAPANQFGHVLGSVGDTFETFREMEEAASGVLHRVHYILDTPSTATRAVDRCRTALLAAGLNPELVDVLSKNVLLPQHTPLVVHGPEVAQNLVRDFILKWEAAEADSSDVLLTQGFYIRS